MKGGVRLGLGCTEEAVNPATHTTTAGVTTTFLSGFLGGVPFQSLHDWPRQDLPTRRKKPAQNE